MRPGLAGRVWAVRLLWLLCPIWSLGGPRAARAADPFRSPDPEVRIQAVRAAAASRDSRAADRLIDLLSDADPRVRLAAVTALEQLGSRRGLRFLKVIAQTDFDARVRQAAARGVRRLDPRGYVATLATADPPPVVRLPPAGPVARHAAFAALGLTLDAYHPDGSAAGLAGLGLRWPHLEVQSTLTFPALRLLSQVRLSPLRASAVVPYLVSGVAVAFNNRVAVSGPSAALQVGGGIRLQPASFGLFFGYAELLADWALAMPRPPRHGAVATPAPELRDFGVPVTVGCGMQLWP